MKRSQRHSFLIALLFCVYLTDCTTDSPTATECTLTFQDTESKQVLTLCMCPGRRGERLV